MLQTTIKTPLSISEVHLIEAAFSKDSTGKTISEISQTLGITLPSVTISVNKLIKKGYLLKEKSSEDGRSVIIKLTREGSRIYRAHRFFHMKMVEEISSHLTAGERELMLSGIKKLNEYFRKTTINPEK
jgi:DNA-binding MarR family transcriptional regulator